MILQSQRQALRPVTTAHLAQTMTLMGLTAAELQQKIEFRPGCKPGAGISRETLLPNLSPLAGKRCALPHLQPASRTNCR